MRDKKKLIGRESAADIVEKVQRFEGKPKLVYYLYYYYVRLR